MVNVPSRIDRTLTIVKDTLIFIDTGIEAGTYRNKLRSRTSMDFRECVMVRDVVDHPTKSAHILLRSIYLRNKLARRYVAEMVRNQGIPVPAVSNRDL